MAPNVCKHTQAATASRVRLVELKHSQGCTWGARALRGRVTWGLNAGLAVGCCMALQIPARGKDRSEDAPHVEERSRMSHELRGRRTRHNDADGIQTGIGVDKRYRQIRRTAGQEARWQGHEGNHTAGADTCGTSTCESSMAWCMTRSSGRARYAVLRTPRIADSCTELKLRRLKHTDWVRVYEVLAARDEGHKIDSCKHVVRRRNARVRYSAREPSRIEAEALKAKKGLSPLMALSRTSSGMERCVNTAPSRVRPHKWRSSTEARMGVGAPHGESAAVIQCESDTKLERATKRTGGTHALTTHRAQAELNVWSDSCTSPPTHQQQNTHGMSEGVGQAHAFKVVCSSIEANGTGIPQV
ncbi:hypothetical protein B0H14DRAFT_3670984 [Mycena olivaceomarginata]|nr:hypothetical protein B0H14DRAFT_3670984 [Mycena olivaceomarginata]